MASTSVEDTIMKMTCDELSDVLRKLIPDKRYEADLQKLIDGNVDGDLFLALPDDPDLMKDLELSAGGKAKIRGIIKKIKDGSLEFGQADKRKLLEPDMPWCSTEIPNDTANGSGNGAADTDGDMQSAWIPPDAVWPWKDYEKIYVEFRHVDLLAKWTIGDGQPMNTDTILRYANTWSDMGGGKIPRFFGVENGRQAQIRVSFNNDKIRNSHLGKRAQKVPAKDPTMNLDLENGCPDDQYKKHVIIHEFGHALGLAHEHQRSDFWKCIKPFTDIEVMRKDLELTKKQFTAQWKEIGKTKAGPHTEYDPDSIMHYWCKVTWLKNGYSDKKKVEQDRDSGHLSDKVAKALLGVHKRHRILASEPSKLDIQLLKKVYGGVEGTESGGAIEQDYDDLAANGPNPRTGKPGDKKRVTADSGVSTDDQTERAIVDMPAKKQKVIEAPDEESELMFDQDYNVEVTNAYLSRLSWTEDGRKQVVRIYDDASHKWHEIGENLGIDPGILVGIGRDGRDERDRMIKVLGKWYENACGLPHYEDYPRTWGGLLKLLDDSDLGQLAKKVQKALLQQKKPSGRVMAGGPPAPVNGQNGGQGSELKAKDLDRVYNAVIGARSKWYHIGLALEVDPDDLDSIKDVNRGNPDGCLTDVLKKFLRQVSPRPSWKRLADAMASLSVGRGDIAEDLRKQYCLL